MLRLKAFSLIRFLVLGSVFLSLPLHAQDLRKWMPNVGDVFIYWDHYSFQTNSGSGSKGISSTTDTVTINGVDIFIDSLHQHTVTTSGRNFYFGARYSNGSNYPFAVGSSEGSVLRSADFVIDFSQASPTIGNFILDTMEVIDGSQSLADSMGAELLFSQSYSETYSTRLRWFAAESYASNDATDGSNASWSLTLIAAVTSTSGVKSTQDAGSSLVLTQDGNFLQVLIDLPSASHQNFSLLDPLGRPIRSWQMPVDAGERQITLNVADVPSGVYFLRISAPGMEEMRKVVIVH